MDVQKISEQETEVVTNLEELFSWEWKYGKTPKFTFTTKVFVYFYDKMISFFLRTSTSKSKLKRAKFLRSKVTPTIDMIS